MSVPFQTETRASKRKLSSQSDLQNTYAFSQNSSLSISHRKRKKLSSFSQSQPTQLLQDIPIYSESPILRDSESITLNGTANSRQVPGQPAFMYHGGAGGVKTFLSSPRAIYCGYRLR